jgi:hypothetical protein
VSQLKASISGAVALAAALLLASGYLLTVARLESKGLPTESLLAALPTSFYMGTAVHTAWLPLGVALTAGAAWVILVTRSQVSTMPGRWYWARWLLVIALYSLAASAVLYREHFHHAPGAFYGRAALGLIGFFIIGMLAREMVATLLRSTPNPTPRIRNGLVASAILVLSILAAVGFRAITVRYLPNAIVEAIVEEDPAACPVPGPHPALPKEGCEDSGFYLGESGDWVYLVDEPSQDPCNPDREVQPNQLVQIAKSEIHRVILFKEVPPEGGQEALGPAHCPHPITR